MTDSEPMPFVFFVELYGGGRFRQHRQKGHNPLAAMRFTRAFRLKNSGTKMRNLFFQYYITKKFPPI